LIAHPESPFKGKHYAPPVEAVDIYATLNELLKLPKPRAAACAKDWVCRPLDGKSLVPVVLGETSSSSSSSSSSPSAAAAAAAAPSGAGYAPAAGASGRLSTPSSPSGSGPSPASEGKLRAHHGTGGGGGGGGGGNGGSNHHKARKGGGTEKKEKKEKKAAAASSSRRLTAFDSDADSDSESKSAYTETEPTSHSRQLLGGTGEVTMKKFEHDFAISQVIRCAPLSRVPKRETALHLQQVHEKEGKSSSSSSSSSAGGAHQTRHAMWNDCDTRVHKADEMSLLGYSMRTLDYRYTAYYPYNRTTHRPDLSQKTAPSGTSTELPVTIPYEEELFDHKNESLNDFTHRETLNLAYRPAYAVVIAHFRSKLAEFVVKAFSNVSPHQ
jgi:hypothetical protein